MYNPKDFEAKWQEYWQKNQTFKTENPVTEEDFKKPKFYSLDMFPYPSGTGLHVGHPKGYIATDVIARHKNAKGFRVLHPMGWDAFGLPAENYAIKTGIHPAIITAENIEKYRQQLSMIGFGYDWSREVNTTDTHYYKWTQWIFKKLFEKGLAYEQDLPINFCPSCKTGLANEEVTNDNTCDRCGHPVEQKKLRQWVLAITKYADRLLNDIDRLDWPEGLKEMQRNWIGKSEGCEFCLKKADDDTKSIRVYTTRVDTVFGMTYVVIAPDHPDVQSFITKEQQAECDAYIQGAKGKSNLERTELAKEKTGVFTGSYVINPFTGDKVSLWIADYVLGSYGTGAVMAVPAHDERDYAFAQKYGLTIKTVIEPITGTPTANEEQRKSIVAIVKNPKNNTYLSINWGENLGWNLFVGGWREEGEHAEACAVREIMEETGYQNILLREVSEVVHHHYFAASKGKYRNIEAIGLFFELLDEERVEQKLEADEQNKFSVEWLTEEEALEKVKDPLHKYLFEKFVCDAINTDDGILFDSGEFSGLSSAQAREKMMEKAQKEDFGGKKVNYKLRDWLFSRQRYWGEPIPLIHLEREDVEKLEVASSPKNSAGLAYLVETNQEKYVYVDEVNKGRLYKGLNSYIICEENLPLVLPNVQNYEPSGDGNSPLVHVPEWLYVEFAPNLSGQRETNTMPQWAGSCWYYLRYMDPKNDSALVDPKIAAYWGEVDSYIGGAEHAVLHLLYARFWHKFLFDIGVVSTNEPFARLRNQGMILGENGEKMSKSRGNVVNPDDVINQYGTDTFRLYEMSLADFTDPAPWNTKAINGVARFLEKVWNTYDGKPQQSDMSDAKIESLLHKTIKKVEQDISICKFNTAISALMILNNAGLPKDEKLKAFWLDTFVRLIHPFTPHIAEELWKKLGHTESIYFAPWPVYDEAKLVEDTVTIAVQVNGKLRATLELAFNVSQDEAYATAMSMEEVAKWTSGKNIKKVIFVPNKLLSLVVAD